MSGMLGILFDRCEVCGHLGWSHDNLSICAECGCADWKPSQVDLSDGGSVTPSSWKRDADGNPVIPER